MNQYLSTPIEYLKGVGPQKASLLKSELGVHTFEDLLFHFPFRYVDRSQVHKVSEASSLNGFGQFRGQIVSIMESGVGRNKRLTAKFQDDSGMIDLVWFKGINWVKNSLKPYVEIQVYGKPTRYKNKWNIAHPEMSAAVNHNGPDFRPVYSSTEKLTSRGLNSRGIAVLIRNLLEDFRDPVEDFFEAPFRSHYDLMPLKDALITAHIPTSLHVAEQAMFRLKFEELFFLQMELLVRKKISFQKSKGHVMKEVGDHFNTFYKRHIPFDLTGAQKKVLREIRHDMQTGHHMNRLLQGDVGSGKTLVALLTTLLGLDNGFQAAIMAPTEILANQHFDSISEMLDGMNIQVELLTGSTGKKHRIEIDQGLQDGSIHILIGTHALLEPHVQFKNLGVVVIDEQHRFGVAQRATMRKKNTIPPHILVMTATPIPRTLAMTFYGDLDVSVIDELPPGRKPITTIHRRNASRLRVFGFLKEEIAKGRQVYIVYPLIHESETMDFNNLMDGFEAIQRAFPRPDYNVSIVHGQMKAADKDFEMDRFVRNETQIMVATTVIEVGVNVPNASVMVIESAERFGLSQLHQLRGRVGRGAEQSYCVLMTGDKLSKETIKRMETMVRTNDGFEIAEVDLQLRGPGDLIGTQQSGMLNLKVADIAKDNHLVVLARNAAKKMLEKDPALEHPMNAGVKKQLNRMLGARPNWGDIA